MTFDPIIEEPYEPTEEIEVEEETIVEIPEESQSTEKD